MKYPYKIPIFMYSACLPVQKASVLPHSLSRGRTASQSDAEELETELNGRRRRRRHHFGRRHWRRFGRDFDRFGRGQLVRRDARFRHLIPLLEFAFQPTLECWVGHLRGCRSTRGSHSQRRGDPGRGIRNDADRNRSFIRATTKKNDNDPGEGDADRGDQVLPCDLPPLARGVGAASLELATSAL